MLKQTHVVLGIFRSAAKTQKEESETSPEVMIMVLTICERIR